MYGENGGLMRAELSALLRQHRIQQRIGGEGIYTVAATTTTDQRRRTGELIRRYRQSVLVWCHQATIAAAPGTAASNVSHTPVNPFRAANSHPGPLTALSRAVEQ